MNRVLTALCAVMAPVIATAAEPGPAEQCARAGNDDTVRPYDPELKAGLLLAYAQLFPQSQMPPDQQAFRAGAHIRCMDGRLLACFTGANLPCGKLNTARDNQGAEAFCRSNPQASIVPAFAAGHDAAYTFRCSAGRAEITGETFPLDRRGFAATLWAPLTRPASAGAAP